MQALIVTHKKKTAATRKWTEKNWYNVQNNSFIVFLWQQQEQKKKKQNQCCTREDNFSRRFIVFQTYTCSYNACYTGYSTRYFQLFVNLLSFYSPIKYFRVNQKQMKGGHCYVCSGETACVQHTQHNSIQCTCCVVVVSLKLTYTHTISFIYRNNFGALLWRYELLAFHNEISIEWCGRKKLTSTYRPSMFNQNRCNQDYFFIQFFSMNKSHWIWLHAYRDQ